MDERRQSLSGTTHPHSTGSSAASTMPLQAAQRPPLQNRPPGSGPDWQHQYQHQQSFHTSQAPANQQPVTHAGLSQQQQTTGAAVRTEGAAGVAAHAGGHSAAYRRPRHVQHVQLAFPPHQQQHSERPTGQASSVSKSSPEKTSAHSSASAGTAAAAYAAHSDGTVNAPSTSAAPDSSQTMLASSKAASSRSSENADASGSRGTSGGAQVAGSLAKNAAPSHLPPHLAGEISLAAADNLPTSPTPRTTSPVHELERRRALFMAKARGNVRPTGPRVDLAADGGAAPPDGVQTNPLESATEAVAAFSSTIATLSDPNKSENTSRGFRPIAELKAQINAHQTLFLMQPRQPEPSKTLLLSRDLLKIYSKCNPAYQYATNNNPRRVLTKPSKPARNDGYDNDDCDYILYVNDVLGSQEGQQYLILDILGQGTFGQVVKCQNLKTNELVAVKVIKNKPAYYNQSLVEVAILEILGSQYDKYDKHHLVRMKDTFLFRNHLCIVFEMLSVNLYELIKQNQFRGLSTNLVRVFISQILDALVVLNRARIIHCDLKPENILLKNLESPTIKVIDFGSACHENQTVYTYIQSRFYRSPEILMGLPYTSSIDMWSLGCIAAELFLGLPLFPGSSEYNQMSRIVEMLGVPPNYMCERGKTAKNFFNKTHRADNKPIFSLKPMEQYSKEFNTNEQPSKRYFTGKTIEEIINSYPIMRRNVSQAEIEKEMVYRRAFIDFLYGLLNLNPLERWSPQQAKMHPFITGERFMGKFVPPNMPSRSNTSSSSASTGTGPFSSLGTPGMSVSLEPPSLTTASVSAASNAPMAAASESASAQIVPPIEPMPPGENVSAMLDTNAIASSSATELNKTAVGRVMAAETSRSGRPRAATISTSKVQAVPPQLQRLAAIQQQSGNPNMFKKEAETKPSNPKPSNSTETAVHSDKSVVDVHGEQLYAASAQRSGLEATRNTKALQQPPQSLSIDRLSRQSTHLHQTHSELQPIQIPVNSGPAGARSADTNMTSTQHLVMHQYNQIQSQHQQQHGQLQSYPDQSFMMKMDDKGGQSQQMDVDPSSSAVTIQPPSGNSTSSHAPSTLSASVQTQVSESGTNPTTSADVNVQQVVGTFADIQIRSRQGMVPGVPSDMTMLQSNMNENGTQVPMPNVTGSRRASLANLDMSSADRYVMRQPYAGGGDPEQQNAEQLLQQQQTNNKNDQRTQLLPPPLNLNADYATHGAEYPIRKAQSQFAVANMAGNAYSQQYASHYGGGYPSHPMMSTSTALFPLTGGSRYHGQHLPNAQGMMRGSDSMISGDTNMYMEGHPRHGNMGERQLLPSRLPSAGTSAEWEPFDIYGRESETSAVQSGGVEAYSASMVDATPMMMTMGAMGQESRSATSDYGYGSGGNLGAVRGAYRHGRPSVLSRMNMHMSMGDVGAGSHSSGYPGSAGFVPGSSAPVMPQHTQYSVQMNDVVVTAPYMLQGRPSQGSAMPGAKTEIVSPRSSVSGPQSNTGHDAHHFSHGGDGGSSGHLNAQSHGISEYSRSYGDRSFFPPPISIPMYDASYGSASASMHMMQQQQAMAHSMPTSSTATTSSRSTGASVPSSVSGGGYAMPVSTMRRSSGASASTTMPMEMSPAGVSSSTSQQGVFAISTVLAPVPGIYTHADDTHAIGIDASMDESGMPPLPPQSTALNARYGSSQQQQMAQDPQHQRHR